MIVYLYFEDKKNIENCEKNVLFFLHFSVFFHAKRMTMSVPLFKDLWKNYIENMPYLFNFWMLTCKWCFWYVVFEYLIKRKGKKTVGLFFS